MDKYALLTLPGFGVVRSIQYISKNNEYIALASGRISLPGESNPTPGFYSLTSKDLIHWDKLTRVMGMPLSARVDSWSDIYTYPYLMDPKSNTRNISGGAANQNAA